MLPLVYLAHYPRRGAGVVGVGHNMGHKAVERGATHTHACAGSSAPVALALWSWLWTCGSSWWALEQVKRRGLMPFGAHIQVEGIDTHETTGKKQHTREL